MTRTKALLLLLITESDFAYDGWELVFPDKPKPERKEGEGLWSFRHKYGSIVKDAAISQLANLIDHTI